MNSALRNCRQRALLVKILAFFGNFGLNFISLANGAFWGASANFGFCTALIENLFELYEFLP